MSISKIALAIPLSLGLACSTTTQQSHAGSAWTERIATDGSLPGDPPPRGAEATVPTSAGAAVTPPSGPQDGLVVQPAAGSSADGSTWAASDAAGAPGTSGSTGSSGAGGAMGSGGSSETMGSGSASGGSDQGATGSGSSGEAPQGSAAGAGSGDTMAHSDDQLLRGKVSKISKDEISITPRGGAAKTLKLSPETTVTINGKDAKPTQLKQGQMVRASFQSQGGDDVAVKIEVGKTRQGHTKRQGGASGGAGSSGGMGGSSGGADSGASGGSR